MANILSAIGLGSVISTAAMAETSGQYGKYETPAYEVVRSVGDAEVRRYAPHVLAEVTVSGDQRNALRAGFRVLAGYIFGGNTGQASVAMTTPVAQSQKIAMTAPVGQTGGDGQWVVTFTMPSEYTLATLPTPNNAAVRFVETAPKDMIVLTFSGFGRTGVMDARTAELRAIADKNGIDVTGAPVMMFYNDPLTLPWNRRNEVGFELG